MANKITRRELFKDVGAVAATSLLAASAAKSKSTPQTAEASPAAEAPTLALLPKPDGSHIFRMTAGEMLIDFDRRYGSIVSIKQKGDPLGTNFIGNETNTPGVDVSNSRWMGDLVATVWKITDTNPAHRNWTPESQFLLKGKWLQEVTGRSADIRRVSTGRDAFSVEYKGASSNDGGLKSFDLSMSFRVGEGSSLLWDIEVQNTTSRVLEFGELGFPLMVNDDSGELSLDPKTGKPYPPDETQHPLRFPATTFANYHRVYPEIQKRYHEQKVIAHHFIGGHSSYVLIQRPLGNAPFLLLQTLGDTPLECVYRDRSPFASNVYWWRGPNILAVHSWATRNIRHWGRAPWINGHTSLVLQPGEKKSFHFRFSFIPGYDSVRKELSNAGNLGVRVLPAMVVPEEMPAYVEIQSKTDLDRIEFYSDNITLEDRRRDNGKTLLTFSFKGRGQKQVKLHYADGRWTNLFFFCVNDVEPLLKERGKFIVDREFYENPEDPYHRNHMFLPFDHKYGTTFRDSYQSWEVGGSDEYGFSEPLFLAMKNVRFPSAREVKTLETYVADCLFEYIQDPRTYDVHASLYWVERYPSSPWSEWTKARSLTTYRAYNYVHVANIYHALYRIGRQYGLLSRRSPEEYLRMSYRTCLQWFQTEPWGHVGVMGGGNAVQILADIEKEGWENEHRKLLEAMRECDQVFVKDPYPYASEFPVDTTAHEQVYFFTRYFHNTEKNRKTLQVIKALRGGDQPVWFQYGNDNKGDLTCWYTESTNGWALLKGFEDTGDMDMLVKGYAGVMSVQVNMLPHGMGFGNFLSSPAIMDHEAQRTLDNGVAQLGFILAAKSYVIDDPSFGLIGFGCRVDALRNSVRVFPKDGLRKRLLFDPHKIDLEATQGEFDEVVFDNSANVVEIHMSDSTGVVRKAELEIKGLQRGTYRIQYEGGSSQERVSNGLKLSLPIARAKKIRVQKM